ncbi:SRP54-type protein, GTPase domain-containing protein [Ditylenchus destructor]|nr:SRP54-type protein, GTPase domain-containing protein [Ditylenchus destructor]
MSAKSKKPVRASLKKPTRVASRTSNEKRKRGRPARERKKKTLEGRRELVAKLGKGSPNNGKRDRENKVNDVFPWLSHPPRQPTGDEASGKINCSHDETNTTPAADVVPKTGWFSAFKSLVGNKQLNKQELKPIMGQLKEALIGKNVTAEVARKIRDAVGEQLKEKVNTCSGVESTVREAMRDSLVQLLTPVKPGIRLSRGIVQAKAQKRPYVIVFCGADGVGKSTCLAKIAFWLNENSRRVLIDPGNTPIKQLRTHTRQLNALHPRYVQLYEQGYGKDPASLAAAAIQIADKRQIDVVLVDTVGRMPDNKPLMRVLSKLIRVNKPDLVLFVGEATVGNEAVDQLVNFNQALADNSATDANPRLINGVMLTKFDTIDDKAGAAVSMTRITGQPIVFIGTGQTYKDFKNLNVNAIVDGLLK